MRAWRKEELRLAKGSWLNPWVPATVLLLLAALAGSDAWLRHRAIQAEHNARLRESHGILTAVMAGVERTALDWGHWNSMYRWVTGRYPDFVTSDIETAPIFDEGGLFLIYYPDGSGRLSYGHRGHDHPSYQALFGCAQRHLHRMPTVLSRLSLLCRDGDGLLYLGVATPISDSNETAPAIGTLVMFDPLLMPRYGPAFNGPLEWITRHMRQIRAPADLRGGLLPRDQKDWSPAVPPPTVSGAALPGIAVAPPLASGEKPEALDLPQPLFTEQGQMITLRRDPALPLLLQGVGRDLLLALAALGSVLTMRMLLLRERRAQRLKLRRSEQLSNRRIRHASHDLDGLLERLGPAGSAQAADERVLARLIDAPAAEGQPLRASASMERKLERLADRFQYFLERAKHLALLDPLTQLPNRRYFIEQVELLMEGRRDASSTYAVLFVDIDKFKSINDSYGHAIGDAALVLVADQLRALTRSDDFLGRYGGDEFAILVALDRSRDGSDQELRDSLLSYAQRIVAPFEQAVDLGGFQVELSISVGISVIEGSDPDLEGAMRRSDIAMYRAKQNAKDRIAIFNKAEDASHLDNYQLYVDLMQAIRDRHFQVLFQPILDQHGRLHSLEALTRWQHPRLGTVGPEVFVDLAERYRQMNTLSDELIGLSLTAYRELADLQPDLRLSLNLPPSKLSDPLLISELSRQLEQHGIEASRITIELTERSVLLPNALVTANLSGLRDCGVAISLDDFGTGYSSLSLLSTLQPDEVKIDKSFVMAMDQDDYARQIVTLIAEMAPRMDLLVVAEGVEDAKALALLRELGINYFQGFHFCRPLTVAELRESPLLRRSGDSTAAAASPAG